ncbi:MAG: hypothetical protein ACI4F2_10780 [Acutalibacteraceae bacterium]
MLSKSKKFMMVFISVILSLQVLISSCLIASANDLTEADANSISNSLSNDAGFFSSTSDQEIIYDVLNLVEGVVTPEKTVDWAARKFLSEALGLKSKSEQESADVMEKLDKLMDGQSKLQESMNTLSKQVTCEQLNGFLNTFQKLTSEQTTNDVYNTLRGIDKDEEEEKCSAEVASARRLQCLTTDCGLTEKTMSRADKGIDKYTHELATALTTPMKVTYEDGKTLYNDLFEINYQSLRRTYHWENQAYDEWIAFQNKALGTFSIAVTVERLSLLARIEKINKYNEKHPDPNDQLYTDSINNRLKTLDDEVTAVKKLVNRKVKIRDNNERYYWTPGHEILFYTTINTKDIPQENTKAGVGTTAALNKANGLTMKKNVNGYYVPAVNYGFWQPFIRYEGGNKRLVNYDQLNAIYKDYGGKANLYDIFFSKTEGNFKHSKNVNKNCMFVIDGEKSETTGKSYYITYKPYFFKADQVFCYGVENSKINKGKLPTPSKIHLCYYHYNHSDPKTGENCVGIGIKSVGELEHISNNQENAPSNDQEIAKEETYCDYSETIVWSEKMDDIQLPLSENTGDLISVSADDNIITEDKYSISDDKTLITLKKEFLLTLEDGIHTLVVESSDAINCFSFTVKAETTLSEPGNSTSDEQTNSTKADMGIPQTGDSNSWKIWIYLFAFSGLILIIALKKHKKISR